MSIMENEKKISINLDQANKLNEFLNQGFELDIEIRKLEFELNEKKHERKFIQSKFECFLNYDLSKL